MYCTFCEKQIADDAVFCPYCGKTTPQSAELAELVAAARTGDQDAVSTLYEKTYSKVYYTVKSMIKDEDAVFDIVQDTYIKAFAHLDSFQGDIKFLPWVRQIAANTARDWLKKKRPMLFAELNSGDGQDIPVEELIPDERGENLPDQVIDQKETKRLIREIIEELPEDQRAAIGMFYYEEMSVKEIAAAMGVSESAVKSRLMYGRNKIEKKVRELEKQGTKLYSLAPLPFLLLLFRNQKVYAAEVPDSRILHAILTSQPTGAGTAVGAAQDAGMTGAVAGTEAAGAAAGGLGALKIGLIALGAVAVVGLGAFGAAQIASRSAEHQESSVMEDDNDWEESEEPEVSEESVIIDEALEQYRIIISQADSYDYNDEAYSQWVESVYYQYALVQMQPDDPVPTLLLAKAEVGLSTFIRIFQYDPDTKTVCQPAEAIGWGVRTSFGMAEDGNGILYGGWSGGTGEGTFDRITLDGNSLNYETCWTGQVFDEDSGHPRSIDIEWHEIEDLSALDNWTAPESGEAAQSEPADSSTLPTDGDRIVLTGTVGTYSYDKIVELQGQPDPLAQYYDEYESRIPNFEDPRKMTYRVIVLDTPQILRIRPGDGPDGPDDYFSNEALMINLYWADGMDQYEGQHITFSIDPDSTHWPSDIGVLPLGQPWTSDIHVLE